MYVTGEEGSVTSVQSTLSNASVVVVAPCAGETGIGAAGAVVSVVDATGSKLDVVSEPVTPIVNASTIPVNGVAQLLPALNPVRPFERIAAFGKAAITSDHVHGFA